MDPQCDGKIKYPTKAAALKRIEGQVGRHHQSHRNAWGKRLITTYRCPRCGNWHVGGSVPAKKPVLNVNEIDDVLMGMLPSGVMAKLGRMQ